MKQFVSSKKLVCQHLMGILCSSGIAVLYVRNPISSIEVLLQTHENYKKYNNVLRTTDYK